MPSTTHNLAFWLIILALNLSSFLVLLEGTIISNALSKMTDALDGTGTLWIGSAYNLAAAAFMPAAGGLAQAFGRKPVILTSLMIFSLGSTLCGVARSITFLIAGRVIQGLGGAGVFTTCAIILSDIVPLSDRGVFNGINQMTWCLASALGPAIGGLLAAKGYWRWIFFVNLPFAFPAMVIIAVFLQLKTPHKDLSRAVRETDWIGIILVTLSSTSICVGLVCGGVKFAWTAWQIVLPFCLGTAGFMALVIHEIWGAAHPLIPLQVMNNRTTFSGYVQIFLVPIPFLAVIFYMPVYFQACKAFSESKSGIALFGVAVTTPLSSVVTGLLVKVAQIYRPQIWLGWILTMTGLALLSTVDEYTRDAVVIVYETLSGIGFGIQFAALYFPVLAPLPLSFSASAIAFFTFLRMFSQIWGINIGGAILQSELPKRLQTSSIAFAFEGTEVMSVVPLVAHLEGQALGDVRRAFAESLAMVWKVMAGICTLGLVASTLMKHMELPTGVDSNWGMKERTEAPENGIEKAT